MVVTMRIISTGPMMIPQGPNMVIPANTDSNISAEFSRASRGTRIGRRTLSMLVTTSRCHSSTKIPPAILP
ncbi:Uncharacterised protein [Mycobacterium tuberculosis]|uniref:Uncharacterized protein n=1 Tax=Mycobacterium tuberculosis TaxID=1773 RepID=A0A916PC37_MYCTX|nr:Uncharacterised protein [Mycobacterium tuberculosis]COY31682.1 Uncharacterised protein [Mycobacterium tuberculosis]COY49170.1 Uncharacterised protein [Mycobacterium tuberculosis]COY91556.1 Uncharacterised protein [Mycobacterium tuberculosis]